MQSDQINELATALAKAQAKIKAASKQATNPHFNRKYADLADVWEACREPLSENGLAVIQTTDAGVGGVTVLTTLAHSSGQWMRGSLTLKPVKEDPQGIGSAITYARRYSLAAMVGVAPDDDDDGNAASAPRDGNGAVKPKPPARPTPPSAPPRDMDAEYSQAMNGRIPDDPPPEEDSRPGEVAPPRLVQAPHPKSADGVWKTYAKKLAEEAAFAPDRLWLTKFQQTNSVGIKAIRDKSEAMHQWLTERLNEIDASFAPERDTVLAAG